MQVADKPPCRDITHDVFNRRKGEIRIGLVVHGQYDAGDNLQHQHDQRQRAKVIPDVEVLRHIVLRHMFIPDLRQRETVIDPVD